MISIVAVGSPERTLLDAVASVLGASVVNGSIDPSFAWHPERNQYHSSHLLERLPPGTLGITNVDLFIPILTFVFGEAELGGTRAIVSYHRLSQELYGLPPDPALRTERLIKEAIHELGHTAALTHCDDYECVMAPSHAVEWIDLKGRALCMDCGGKAAAFKSGGFAAALRK